MIRLRQPRAEEAAFRSGFSGLVLLRSVVGFWLLLIVIIIIIRRHQPRAEEAVFRFGKAFWSCWPESAHPFLRCATFWEGCAHPPRVFIIFLGQNVDTPQAPSYFLARMLTLLMRFLYFLAKSIKRCQECTHPWPECWHSPCTFIVIGTQYKRVWGVNTFLARMLTLLMRFYTVWQKKFKTALGVYTF